MGNTMTNQLNYLISENLDLNLFFSLNLGEETIRLLAYYSEDLEKYLVEKSFVQKDYLYQNDIDKVELESENGKVRIVLMKD
jgi:hypothetical protein